jgi:AcrR family transcriptional regulator
VAIRNACVSKKVKAEVDAPPKATRRRGDALEQSLLDAAWDVLAKNGFGGFTMEAVALQARTSRTVLYRRWETPSALAMDAIGQRMISNSIEVPDTGNVRDDLVSFLDELGRKRAEIMVLFSMGAVQIFGCSQETFADFMERISAGRTSKVALILQRAVDRGEIDPARLTARIAKLPMHLGRYEMLSTLKPISRDAIEEIVDDIFLPLVRADGGRTGRRS